MSPNNSAHAESLAAQAFAHIAGDEKLLNMFLNVTGVDVGDIAQLTEEPVFLAGVLDFLLANEKDLNAFCESHNIDPSDPLMARRHLPGAPIE